MNKMNEEIKTSVIYSSYYENDQKRYREIILDIRGVDPYALMDEYYDTGIQELK